MARRIARDKAALAACDALDPETLSARVALDRTLFALNLHDELLFDETLRWWRHRPSVYLDVISGGIFALVSRAYAPAVVRMRAAIARENAVSRVVAEAESNLAGVDATSAELAAGDAFGTAAFVEDTVPQAFAGAGTAADRAALRRSTVRARDALRGFGGFLKRLVAHPGGTYAIGSAAYRARLRYEEGVDMPLDAYLAVGERAFARTRAELIATAARIDPHATPQAVIARLERQHPDAAHLIPAAERDLVELRRFVVARRLVDLPADADVHVTETPVFLRATTVASMDAPGPLEPHPGRAFYNVTPADPRDSRAAQDAYLATFNDFERPIVSAHEIYPGHFTEYAIHRPMALSLTEKLLRSTSFVEGWAHYDEALIVDEGWGNGDPRVRLMQLREAILRNARFVVGVRLHTAGMTIAQAERFFREQAFFDPVTARIEARRGTQDATYGYYTLGKLEILKLREDYRKKLGPDFTLAGFHTALLAYGAPPIPLLRPLLLGPDDDGKILPE